jgi:hypothetical protein
MEKRVRRKQNNLTENDINDTFRILGLSDENARERFSKLCADQEKGRENVKVVLTDNTFKTEIREEKDHA